MNKRKNGKKLLLFCVILILVLGLIFGGLQLLESTVFTPAPVETEKPHSLTVTRDGVDYYPRQDISVIMALGIDERGPVVPSGSYRNNAEADAIVLMILDHADETYTLLCINRDSMVRMPVLSIGGRQAGTTVAQLALSHTYGEGLQDSGENTRTTVSNLFNGILIDHYVALNMDGISIINDAVGGVTVNVEDDFSEVDPSIPMGPVTLNGSQALNFVQSRKNVGTQLNISRMGRQEQYMYGLMDALVKRAEGDDAFMVRLFDKLSDYMVTDCSINVITGLMQRCAEYEHKETVSPVGENVLGEKHYEFYLDEEALDELTLRIFYAPKH